MMLGNGVIYENKVWFPKEGYIIPSKICLRFASKTTPECRAHR